MLTMKRVSDLRVIFALGLESRAAKVTRHRIRYNADRLDELESVHRLFDGVEVEHRAPRRPNPLHCGRRVVNRIGLSGHELFPELDRLADFPYHPGAAVGLFTDDAEKVTGITDARGEVLFDDVCLVAVDREVEGPVVGREIEFFIDVPAEQPILGSLVIVIVVADEHFILRHVPFPFSRIDSR